MKVVAQTPDFELWLRNRLEQGFEDTSVVEIYYNPVGGYFKLKQDGNQITIEVYAKAESEVPSVWRTWTADFEVWCSKSWPSAPAPEIEFVWTYSPMQRHK